MARLWHLMAPLSMLAGKARHLVNSHSRKVMISIIAFKESEVIEIVKITGKAVFLKFVGPTIGSTSNKKLFKRAMTLEYNSEDYQAVYVTSKPIVFFSFSLDKFDVGVIFYRKRARRYFLDIEK